jgi:hypothetical protein
MRVRAWSTGPLLASLGASAVLVGLVSGAGEAMALLLRLVSGSWADLQRTLLDAHVRRLSLTVVCVPALAITPFLAGAGLAVAFVLAAGNGTAQTVGGARAGPARDH